MDNSKRFDLKAHKGKKVEEKKESLKGDKLESIPKI